VPTDLDVGWHGLEVVCQADGGRVNGEVNRAFERLPRGALEPSQRLRRVISNCRTVAVATQAR